MSSKINILVVDDEIEMRIALQKSLEKCGYRVELAHNVETALNKLASNSYNLVLTDMTMPKQSGMEILNYIQKANLIKRLQKKKANLIKKLSQKKQKKKKPTRLKKL